MCVWEIAVDLFRDEKRPLCPISTHFVTTFIPLPRSHQYEIYYPVLALKSHMSFSSLHDTTLGFSRSAAFCSVSLNLLQHHFCHNVTASAAVEGLLLQTSKAENRISFSDVLSNLLASDCKSKLLGFKKEKKGKQLQHHFLQSS